MEENDFENNLQGVGIELRILGNICLRFAYFVTLKEFDRFSGVVSYAA